MDNNQEIIIVYTKYPIPGHSKTRLIPALGASGAAGLQEQMTASLVSRLRTINEQRPVKLLIHYDGGNPELMTKWLGKSFPFIQQTGKDLGERMLNSLSEYLGSSARIVLVGSDCPGVNRPIITEALDGLKKKDVVIGPTFDGGYYLIGIRGTMEQRHLKTLFSNIHWSIDSVYDDTIHRIQQLHLSYHILPRLHDIDTPEDLGHIRHYSGAERRR